MADIHALAFQAEQHGGGVLAVDVEIGLHQRDRAFHVAKSRVVESQHLVMLAALDVEHRLVPEDVVLKVVAALEIRQQAVDPGDALGPAALHFQHMRHRMRGPEIGRVTADRLAPRILGNEVISRLLMGEGAAGEDGAIARHTALPMRHDALDRAQHGGRLAHPEGGEMVEAEGHDVARVFGEDLLPDGDGAVLPAIRPGAEGRHVHLLTRIAAEAARLVERGPRARHMGGFIGEHGEARLHDVRQRRLRIQLQRGLQAQRRIGAVFQESLDQVVIGGGGRIGGEGGAVALSVVHHGQIPHSASSASVS